MDVGIQGVEEILRGFARLPVGIQKKYLGKAVSEVAKQHIPNIKALTPRGPTGNLRRSVGMRLEKKKRNTTAMSVLGYRRRAGGNSREQGFHAWWIDNGVKRRSPKGQALRVPPEFIGTYDYLKGAVSLIGDDGASIYFRTVAGFEGTGKFERWAAANLPGIKKALVGKLEGKLGAAIQEAEIRALRAKGK
jgi:hypothetical protein